MDIQNTIHKRETKSSILNASHFHKHPKNRYTPIENIRSGRTMKCKKARTSGNKLTLMSTRNQDPKFHEVLIIPRKHIHRKKMKAYQWTIFPFITYAIIIFVIETYGVTVYKPSEVPNITYQRHYIYILLSSPRSRNHLINNKNTVNFYWMKISKPP